jgi:hypothetical protein
VSDVWRQGGTRRDKERQGETRRDEDSAGAGNLECIMFIGGVIPCICSDIAFCMKTYELG